MSNQLCFLVPVQSHYTEMFKSTGNLENILYQQAGEWKVVLGSLWGSLNFVAGYK